MLLFIFSIIEILVLITAFIAKLLLKALSSLFSGDGEAQTAGKPQNSGKKKDLSDDQRFEIIKAILGDSLLVLDRTYDDLFNTGEAIFCAPEALGCSYFEFKEQYGSRKWRAAWERALAERFDCQCDYADKGNFHVFGKAM